MSSVEGKPAFFLFFFDDNDVDNDVDNDADNDADDDDDDHGSICPWHQKMHLKITMSQQFYNLPLKESVRTPPRTMRKDIKLVRRKLN